MWTTALEGIIWAIARVTRITHAILNHKTVFITLPTHNLPCSLTKRITQFGGGHSVRFLLGGSVAIHRLVQTVRTLLTNASGATVGCEGCEECAPRLRIHCGITHNIL